MKRKNKETSSLHGISFRNDTGVQNAKCKFQNPIGIFRSPQSCPRPLRWTQVVVTILVERTSTFKLFCTSVLLTKLQKKTQKKSAWVMDIAQIIWKLRVLRMFSFDTRAQGSSSLQRSAPPAGNQCGTKHSAPISRFQAQEPGQNLWSSRAGAFSRLEAVNTVGPSR